MSASAPVNRALIPTIVGNKGVKSYVENVLGIPMTERYVKQAIHDGDLKPRKFRNVNHFSPASIVEWITGEKLDTAPKQRATASR